MSKEEDSVRRPAKGPRVGLAQMSPALGDLASNMERHRQAVAKAVSDGCDLLVFPELSLAGYRLKDSVPDVAIKRDSDTWKELEALSADVAIVVGFVEETPDHLFYNAAAYFEGGRCLAVHRKTYLPTYGMFDEQRYFARGRRIEAFDTKCGRVALLVCEDMLHPSALTVAACDGATLIIVPSASPARGVVATGEADSNARSWEAYNQVMARTFGVWVAYCNRVGVEDGVSFWGGSEIVSPAGERVAKGAYYDEDNVSAVLADDAVRRRRIVNPLVRDEDLDLTINELARIRGRAAEAAPAGKEERPRRPAAVQEGDAPNRRQDADDKPPRRDREDGEGPPRRSGFGAKPRFGDDRPRDDRPRFGSDRPRDDRPRFGNDRPRDDRPRFGNDRPRDDRPRFGSDRPRDDRPRDDRPRFGNDRPRDDRPRFGDGPPRGGFGDRGGKPGFGGKPRFGDGPPRGGFGQDRPRDEGRGGFGGPPRGRDDRGGFGDRGGKPPFGAKPGFGGKPRFGDGPPRGGFGGKPRFGDDAPPRPRDRQRPEPARKPFVGGAPKPRGRKGD